MLNMINSENIKETFSSKGFSASGLVREREG